MKEIDDLINFHYEFSSSSEVIKVFFQLKIAVVFVVE